MMQIIYEQLELLPHARDDLWLTLMAFNDGLEGNPKMQEQEVPDEASSAKYTVSRFGALLATSLLNLPGDTEYRIIEEYCPPLSSSNGQSL